MGARRLSALQSGSERGARLQRPLCAGVPAERPGDHAAHALLLAAGLVPHSPGIAPTAGVHANGRRLPCMGAFLLVLVAGAQTPVAPARRRGPARRNPYTLTS